eukprot:3657857-Prymnesium_polylepis.2
MRPVQVVLSITRFGTWVSQEQPGDHFRVNSAVAAASTGRCKIFHEPGPSGPSDELASCLSSLPCSQEQPARPPWMPPKPIAPNQFAPSPSPS